MQKLLFPPVADVKDIVLDMMPVVAPEADAATIQKSIELAETFIATFHTATEDPTTEAVMIAMLRGVMAMTDNANAFAIESDTAIH